MGGLRPTDDTMAEPPSWDECTEEGDCQKTIEFGGFAKLFWGCKMTFTKEDDEFRREIECGGKSFEGMGKKEYADNYKRFDFFDTHLFKTVFLWMSVDKWCC